MHACDSQIIGANYRCCCVRRGTTLRRKGLVGGCVFCFVLVRFMCALIRKCCLLVASTIQARLLGTRCLNSLIGVASWRYVAQKGTRRWVLLQVCGCVRLSQPGTSG